VKKNPKIRYVAVIAALCLLSIGLSGCISQSGYEFQSGISPPKTVSDLMKNGTVVLFLTKNGCTVCEQVKPKIADLQSQYEGTNVTFAHFNFEDNATSQAIFRAYSVQDTPTTIVVRKDGAVAKFIGDFDTNTVKSAIEDARR
jgi:thiol-disulfide isomerase/thioredoxin